MLGRFEEASALLPGDRLLEPWAHQRELSIHVLAGRDQVAVLVGRAAARGLDALGDVWSAGRLRCLLAYLDARRGITDAAARLETEARQPRGGYCATLLTRLADGDQASRDHHVPLGTRWMYSGWPVRYTGIEEARLRALAEVAAPTAEQRVTRTRLAIAAASFAFAVGDRELATERLRQARADLRSVPDGPDSVEATKRVAMLEAWMALGTGRPDAARAQLVDCEETGREAELLRAWIGFQEEGDPGTIVDERYDYNPLAFEQTVRAAARGDGAAVARLVHDEYRGVDLVRLSIDR